jgi:hypothetical protein
MFNFFDDVWQFDELFDGLNPIVGLKKMADPRL